MDINKEIKKVFELYSSGKFEEAQSLNNQILEIQPNNMYAKKYATILVNKIKSNINTKPFEKPPKVRGKTLKCVHCLAKIPFSSLTLAQRESIKNGKYNNLEIKCPYCSTKFILQKRKANSIFGIKIGDFAEIKGEKYRAVGYVEYKGMWYSGKYSGKTNYLEWILLGDDNSYYYFSEGRSYEDGSLEFEFELSKKVIPNFRIPSNFSESTKVTVISIYGENSKNYIVGEETELYEFKNSGKSYVKEVEGAGSQKEAGIYETKELSESQASKIFGKEITSKYNIKGNSDKNSGKAFAIISGIIGLFMLPALLFEPIFNLILENKTKIEINKLENSYKIKLNFKDSSIMQEKQTSTTRYDYGGTRTYYSKNTGLKFSVKTKEDIDILKNIENLSSENEIKKMFNGNLYKLK